MSTDEKVDAFLTEFEALCRKHGVSIRGVNGFYPRVRVEAPPENRRARAFTDHGYCLAWEEA